MSGSLLIGHQAGGVSILEDGRFTRFDPDQTPRTDGVTAFTERTNGLIRATTGNGLMQFDGHQWKTVGSEWDFPHPLIPLPRARAFMGMRIQA